MSRLDRYRAMRDFSITPEPAGRPDASARKGKTKLSYFIQRHHATRLHYDFRLEWEGVLKSWAVPKGPCLDPSVKRLAMQTEDHPFEYGEFEGTIPEKQYGAGDVLLWDRGEWIPEDPDPGAALAKGRLHFRLDGQKLHGRWILTRTRGEEGKPAWLLIKRDDEEARTGEDAEITLLRPESVKKAPKAEKRARKLTRPAKDTWVPEFVAPMLATLVSEPPRSGDWVYEVKHDGYRMLCRISGGEVRLFTRTGNDWTARLPRLAEAVKKLKLKDSLLDGEIVVPGEGGRSDFQRLQNAFDAGRDADIVYFVFDAPYLGGQDLRRLALAERKKRLAKVAFARADGRVRLSEHLEGDARQVLDQACKLGLEGLIGKEAASTYVSGRSRCWIKLKCRRRQDFVIGGYTAPQGSRQGFGALLVGFYDAGGKLQYAGKVGTGFDERLLSSLFNRMIKLKKGDSPFANPPRERGITWVQPKLVGEVAYTEKTKEGILRQASFLGLREDIPAKSVGEEKAISLETPKAQGSGDTVLGVRISNSSRLIWKEERISKLDYARYCEAVGEWLLPHVKDRPLTLVRCPDGVGSECFYQRHLMMGASPGDLKTVRRERSSKGAYIYASTLEAVISAVQNGAVEFHTWGATVPHIARPDRITIDLDPGPGLPWKELLKATRLTKTLLDGLSLRSFLKTTGGKGLHVVLPIEPALGWDEVKEFSRLIAEFLTRADPGLFTPKIAKDRRTGKVFVDYLRNSETASAVCAFSARARPGALVSTPVHWDELGAQDLRPLFSVRSVEKRLAGLREDPWAGYSATRQGITPAMWRALGTPKGAPAPGRAA